MLRCTSSNTEYICMFVFTTVCSIVLISAGKTRNMDKIWAPKPYSVVIELEIEPTPTVRADILRLVLIVSLLI
jgi:hypothetical protein